MIPTFNATSSNGALNIAILTEDGYTPSTENPLNLTFAYGGITKATRTTALTLTIPHNTTLGIPANTPFRLWLGILKNDANLVPVVINCRVPSVGITRLNPARTYSALAFGNDAGVMYSSYAVPASPIVIVGYMTWEGGLQTPGNWSNPVIQTWVPGVALPGDVLQAAAGESVAWEYNSTPGVIPTAAQVNLTLESAANEVVYEWAVTAATYSAYSTCYGSLLRGGAIVGLQSAALSVANGVYFTDLGKNGSDFPGSVGPHNYAIGIQSGSGSQVGMIWGTLKVAEVQG